MRSLRLLVIFAAFLAICAGQYLLAQEPLEFLRTAWVSTNLPLLWDVTNWPPDDRQTLGLYLAGIGALLFGLIATGWPTGSLGGRTSPAESGTPGRAAPLAGLLPAGVALLLGLILFLYFLNNEPEPAWTRLLWVGSLALFVVASWLAAPNTPAPDDPSAGQPAPERSWPSALLLLILVGFLLGWQLTSVPLRVDGDEGSHGLQALEIVSGWQEHFFGPGWANIPLIAYYPAALGISLSGDWLLGNRLAGFYAGLLTVAGVWLLGCELFRRSPNPETGADDGRSVALLAAALTAAGYTFIHFGRIPQYMEPVAWGTLGLWALHRGVRTGSRPALALSGLLLGLTGTLYYSGRVFGVVALLWWLWIVFGRRRWAQRVGWSGFGFWAGGGALFLAPFLGLWLRQPAAFLTRLREVSVFGESSLAHMESVFGVQGLNAVLFENARRTALTFWLFGDKSTQFGWQQPMLDALIGPLLILGIGFLFLNLDRTQSWLLLAWLAAVIVLGGAVVINSPYWPRLLPALPVAGLICGLAIDRTRSTLARSSAPWLGRFSTVLFVGVLLLAGMNNWISWYEAQTVWADAESFAGRAIRNLPQERTAILIDTGSPLRAEWGERTVEYLAGGPYAGRRASISPDNWPANLPPQSSVLLQPDDQALAAELQSRYPGGVFLLQRDRVGNPIIFVYQLP